jgi:hypothetical protein
MIALEAEVVALLVVSAVLGFFFTSARVYQVEVAGTTTTVHTSCVGKYEVGQSVKDLDGGKISGSVTAVACHSEGAFTGPGIITVKLQKPSDEDLNEIRRNAFDDVVAQTFSLLRQLCKNVQDNCGLSNICTGLIVGTLLLGILLLLVVFYVVGTIGQVADSIVNGVVLQLRVQQTPDIGFADMIPAVVSALAYCFAIACSFVGALSPLIVLLG